MLVCSEVSRALTSSKTATGRLDPNEQEFIAYTIQTNDGGDHRRKDRPHGGMYVKEADASLTLGSSDQTVVAYNWQSGGDVRLSFGKPNLQAHQVPAVGVRRLTPTEAERIQGFPDDWTDVNGMSDSARYRMLGNAVAVPVAEWIGRRIMAVEAAA